jgi:hypothetical protein
LKEVFAVTKSIEERALEVWGVVAQLRQAQLRQAQEELAELIVAINRYMRERTQSDAVVEEIADVEIMLTQLKLVFGALDVGSAVQMKRTRLQRVEDAEKLPQVDRDDSLRWTHRLLKLERRVLEAGEKPQGRS